MLTVANGGKGGREDYQHRNVDFGRSKFEKKKTRSVVIFVEYQKPVQVCYSIGTI